MRTLLVIALIAASVCCAQFLPFPGPGSKGSGAATTTYFGAVASTSTGTPIGTSLDDLTNFYVGLDTSAGAPYATCPGSGSKTLVSLAVYVENAGASAGTARVAIYGPVDGTHDHTLIAQGSAAITVPSTSLSWVEHTAFVNSSGASIPTVTLTGGSTYQLVASATGGNGVSFGWGTAGAHNQFDSNNYTTGFPATIAFSGDQADEMPDIRAGVQ